MKASEDKTFPGAIVASLASPWGQAVSAAGTAPLSATLSASGAPLTVTGLTTPGARVDVAATDADAASASTAVASVQANPDGIFTLPIQEHSTTDVVTVTSIVGNATGYLALCHYPVTASSDP